jgi:hypothetical protein
MFRFYRTILIKNLYRNQPDLLCYRNVEIFTHYSKSLQHHVSRRKKEAKQKRRLHHRRHGDNNAFCLLSMELRWQNQNIGNKNTWRAQNIADTRHYLFAGGDRLRFCGELRWRPPPPRRSGERDLLGPRRPGDLPRLCCRTEQTTGGQKWRRLDEGNGDEDCVFAILGKKKS